MEILTGVLRWIHVLAAIAWLGFGFWLRRLALRSDRLMSQGVELEVWDTHSLGFWQTKKVSQPTIAQLDGLVWSFSQIRWLFVTGISLLALIYYRQPQLYLANFALALDDTHIIFLSITGLIAMPVINELINRLELRSERLYEFICIGHVLSWVAFFTVVFSPHGAMMQIGAMLGTTVVSNILGYLLPMTRLAVQALREGTTPDPLNRSRWDRRNKHTFVLPAIVFFMLSSHFSIIINNDHTFLTISLVICGSVIGRWMLEEMHRNHGVMPRHLTYTAALMLSASLLLLWWWTSSSRQPDIASTAGHVKPHIEAIIQQRCEGCHSQNPSFPGITFAPGGVVLTRDTLWAYARQINIMVAERRMPPGNITRLTDTERATLIEWASSNYK